MRRLEPLTGMRGIAAYSVLIAHALNTSFLYGGQSLFSGFASRLAYFGISLFFVLSGFVIQFNYGKSFASESLGIAAWRFFVARFARLYPLYAVTILCSLDHVPSLRFDQAHVTWAYVTLTQSWFNLEMATFPPDWSVSTEWFFYFAFVPLTMLVTTLRRPIPALMVLCVASFAGLIVLFHFQRDHLTDIVHHWFWHDDPASAGALGWVSYFSPYLRLLEFVCGMIGAKAYLINKSGAPAPIWAWIVLVAGMGWIISVLAFESISAQSLLANITPNFIFAPAIVFLLLYCCQYETALSRILASRPLLFLGEISYSVYVWSFFVITMLSGYLTASEPSAEGFVNSAMKMAATIGLTTVFAYGSYAMIEVPSRRWLRRMLLGDLQRKSEPKDAGDVAASYVMNDNRQLWPGLGAR